MYRRETLILMGRRAGRVSTQRRERARALRRTPGGAFYAGGIVGVGLGALLVVASHVVGSLAASVVLATGAPTWAGVVAFPFTSLALMACAGLALVMARRWLVP